MSGRKSGRYEILKKLLNSVFWSYRAADGSNWSNIFWDWEELVENAGLDTDNYYEIEKAKRLLKETISLSQDQMKLNGYKEEMPNAEINKEVAERIGLSNYVLSSKTINPEISKTKHKWEIDVSDIAAVGKGGYIESLIPKLNSHFDTYNEAARVIREELQDKLEDQLAKITLYSKYGLEYTFKDGSHASMAVFPIGDEKIIENMRMTVAKGKKDSNHES